MAIPKKGSRCIVVDGMKFRWRVRHKATYGQCYLVWNGGIGETTFSVEHAEIPGSVLVVRLEQPHPGIHAYSPVSRGIAIVPSQVAEYISLALASGWKPTQAGKPFQMGRE